MPEKLYPSRRLAKINIRLTRALRRQLQVTARKYGRSMNSQVVQILKEGVEKVNSALGKETAA